MKNVSLLICAILVCLFFSGATAQKNVTTTRQASGFNAVSVSSGVDLYITQGSNESVKIEADEDFQKYVIVKVQNGTLEIYIEPNHSGAINITSLFKKMSLTNKLKAYVTLPDLTKLNASGGSDVYSQGNWKVNALKMVATGGSDIKFELQGAVLETTATGGSDLTLKGKINSLTTSASGGSDVMAGDLQTDKAIVTASGGSDVTVNVTSQLDAKANGGSDIYYKGNPAKISRDSSGGSDITKKN
jgi:hypothetical protein